MDICIYENVYIYAYTYMYIIYRYACIQRIQMLIYI